jgi:hypothetical protein
VDVAGTRYVWPADLAPVEADPPARVRFLAPFDPVVWDRRRFGQVWGWEWISFAARAFYDASAPA